METSEPTAENVAQVNDQVDENTKGDSNTSTDYLEDVNQSDGSSQEKIESTTNNTQEEDSTFPEANNAARIEETPNEIEDNAPKKQEEEVVPDHLGENEGDENTAGTNENENENMIPDEESEERKHKKKKSKDKKKKKLEKDEIIQSLSRSIFGDSDEEEETQPADTVPEVEEESDEDLELKTKKKLKKLAMAKEKGKKRSRDKEEKKSKRSSKRRTEEGEIGDEDISPKHEEQGEEQEDEEQFSERPKKELSEFDQMLMNMKKGRRRKSDRSEAEVEMMIDSFIRKMDAAAEEDLRAIQEERLALNKLKMAGEVETQLCKKDLQRLFLDANILSVLRRWIEPLPDGSLPNLKVRETVLRVLTKFPEIEGEQLKESSVGKMVMYLWKHPSETQANKKMAQGLIERWSRPIFGISARYRDLGEVEEDSLRRREFQKKKEEESESQEGVTDLESALDKKKQLNQAKSSSPTFHARIPDRIALDFRIRPKSDLDLEKLKKKTPTKKLEKQMLQKRAKSVSGKSGGMSVEGRNMSILH